MKTRAVMFPEANRFELTELTLGEPGPSDIVVRTLVSAISPGTERWVLRGLHIGTRFPCVPGYHRIGVVEACGPDAGQVKEGDIVYGSAGRWEEDIVSMWGAHVGLSVGPAGAYTFVADAAPPRIELETLAFTILAGVSNRGVNACAVSAGQKMLIIGSGFVGVCAAQLAASRGAEPLLLDKNPARVSFLTESQPAFPCLNVDDPELDEKLKAFAPEGFDILQDTVGHAPTTDLLVQRLRPQATLLLQAQYFDRERCAIDLDQIKIKELTVKTTCGTRKDDITQTMANIRSRCLDIAPLITHRFDPKDMLAGYELLHTGEPHNLGIVFGWDG